MTDTKPKRLVINPAMCGHSVRHAALAWAQQGVRVLAVWGVDSDGKCACGKKKCESPGKHPIGSEFPEGHKSATADPIKINAVFRRYPNANLGVVPPDGVVVIDVDGDVGRASIAKFRLPATPATRTGRGEHYFFHIDDADALRLPRLQGVDIKRANGFVVVPPSRHRSGVKYRWRKPVGDLAKLKKLMLRVRKVTVDFSKARLTIGEGSRNNTLTSFAGRLRAGGLIGKSLENALGTINKDICRPMLLDDEVRRIARSIGRYPTSADESFKNLSDIKAEKVEWLGYPYFVRGALTIIDGNPGLGKSSVVVALAAAITTGAKLPFIERVEPGRVLFLSAEDDPARVLKPRAIANGADVARIRIQHTPFSLDAKGVDQLRLEMQQHRPTLVIIDPMVAYMGGAVDLYKANDMTHFLAELDALAKEHNACLLLIRHLRKNEADDALHRGMGSVSIIGRVRSALLLGRHPEDPNKRVLAHVKCNYAALGPSIIFSMQSKDKDSQPVVKWEGVTTAITADHLLARPAVAVGRPNSEREEATAFLSTTLRAGPKTREEIRVAAEGRSISYGTLRRAADDMGIKKYMSKKKSYWKLP